MFQVTERTGTPATEAGLATQDERARIVPNYCHRRAVNPRNDH